MSFNLHLVKFFSSYFYPHFMLICAFVFHQIFNIGFGSLAVMTVLVSDLLTLAFLLGDILFIPIRRVNLQILAAA